MPSVIPVSLRYYTDRLCTKVEECSRAARWRQCAGETTARGRADSQTGADAWQPRFPARDVGARHAVPLHLFATPESLFRTRNASGSWDAGKMDSGMRRNGSTEHSHRSRKRLEGQACQQFSRQVHFPPTHRAHSRHFPLPCSRTGLSSSTFSIANHTSSDRVTSRSVFRADFGFPVQTTPGCLPLVPQCLPAQLLRGRGP